MDKSGRVFCLMGPTAVGKTDLAIELLNDFPFEIISVDSAMVFRDMNIGAAKPTTTELELAPHHLIDLIDPTESYSVASFFKDVTKLIDDIHSAGKLPLLVGGTMMYFRALQQGLSQLPTADEAIRSQLLEQAAQHGWQAMHYRLQQVDPIAARSIKANDSQRIQRAMEVYQITGKPISHFWQQQKKQRSYRFINLALFPNNRAFLHARIAKRFKMMLKMGFIEEVERLRADYALEASMPSMRCVGYRQVWQYLEGELSQQEMLDKGIAATRQLAKRQLTWLRSWPDVHYFEPWQIFLKRQILDSIIDSCY